MSTESEALLKKYQDLQSQVQNEQGSAFTSPTYQSSGDVLASKDDLARSASIRTLQTSAEKALSDYQKSRWYGTAEQQKAKQDAFDALPAAEKSPDSTLSKVIHAISTPLYGVVGAAETALGKGTEPGLLANIASNIKEHETFGDLIRKYGISNWVAAPAGLALDIALDPINWATAGTAALVPRLAVGAVKGAMGAEGFLNGIKLAGESGLATKGSKALEMLGYVPGVGKALEKSGTGESLAKYASLRSDWYDRMIGKAVDPETGLPSMTDKTLLAKLADNVSGKFKDYLNNSKYGGQVKAAFHYEPQKTMKEVMSFEDATRNIPLVRTMEDYNAYRASMEAENKGKSFLSNILAEPYVPDSKTTGELALKASKIATEPSSALSGDVLETTMNLKNEAQQAVSQEAKDVVQRALELGQDKTGIRLVDETKDKIGKWLKADFPKVKNVLDNTLKGYEGFIAHFKMAKVPLSVSAYTNSVLGNAVMTNMAGIRLTPQLMDSVVNSFKMVNGGKVPPEFLKNFISNPEVRDFMEKYPKAFATAFGVNPSILSDRALIMAKIDKSVLEKQAKLSLKNIFEESFKEQDKDIASLGDFFSPFKVGKQVAQEAGMANPIFNTSYSADAFEGFARTQQRLFDRVSSISPELGKWYKDISQKPMAMYESLDQGYKLGLFAHLTNNGISRSELDSIKKIIPLAGEGDVVRIPGYDLYKLSPAKAATATQEIYMNYRAMPGVVKVLRGLPVVGSPFASFMYAMASKTAKAAAYNPSFFSKMNSLMAEVSGGQDPAERQNLQSMYNAYLNQPGVVKLPIFTQNPVYMRVQQMLPYYSLNIFQPGARDLDPGLGKTVTDFTDKTGLFSDPVGQTLMNYFILPTVLQESAPKGMFGNQLYPEDATGLQKAAYSARDLGEALVPQVVAPLGTIQGWSEPQSAPIPGDSILKSLPIPTVGTEEFAPSFRYRQFARAARGQSSSGVIGQEPAAQRWLRTFLAWGGVPTAVATINTKDITAGN